MFIIQLTKMKENNFFENVYYIKYKVCTETGVIEDEMSSANVDDFIELINDLKFNELKKNESVKGWLISLDCYISNRKYMYNTYLIGNLFYI